MHLSFDYSHGSIQVSVTIKKQEAKPIYQKMSLKDFVRGYHSEEWYLSTIVPQELMKDLRVSFFFFFCLFFFFFSICFFFFSFFFSFFFILVSFFSVFFSFPFLPLLLFHILLLLLLHFLPSIFFIFFFIFFLLLYSSSSSFYSSSSSSSPSAISLPFLFSSRFPPPLLSFLLPRLLSCRLFYIFVTLSIIIIESNLLLIKHCMTEDPK